MYSYGLYGSGVYSDGLYSDDLYSDGLYSDGLYIYSLYIYGHIVMACLPGCLRAQGASRYPRLVPVLHRRKPQQLPAKCKAVVLLLRLLRWSACTPPPRLVCSFLASLIDNGVYK